jgi:regulator of sirC expression with transglutaminase-like and TPR domain
LVNAAEFYRNAISLDPDLAEAHRGLGLSLMKIGKRRDGQTSLRRYLELNPEAPDAKMIEMMAPKLEASE